MKNDIRNWWIINQIYHFRQKNKDYDGLVSKEKFIIYAFGNDNIEKIFLEGEKNFMNISMSALTRRVIRVLFFENNRDEYGVYWDDVDNVIKNCSSSEINTVRVFGGPKIKLDLTPVGYQSYSLTSFIAYFVSKYKAVWLLIAPYVYFLINYLLPIKYFSTFAL